MVIPLLELEGTWEEIAAQVSDFSGQKLRVRIGETNAILSPTPPDRNPENTPGASSRSSPAAAARSRRRRLPQHAVAACRSGSIARRVKALRALDRRLRMG